MKIIGSKILGVSFRFVSFSRRWWTGGCNFSEIFLLFRKYTWFYYLLAFDVKQGDKGRVIIEFVVV